MQSLLSIVLCVGFSMHLNLKMVSFLCVWIICFEIGLICRESFTTITLDMSKLKHKKRIQQVKNLVKPPSPWRISKSNQKKWLNKHLYPQESSKPMDFFFIYIFFVCSLFNFPRSLLLNKQSPILKSPIPNSKSPIGNFITNWSFLSPIGDFHF